MTHLNTNNKQNHKDPVCGMDVSSENNSITAIWNNQTYYFCAQNCRKIFEKSPEAYQKESSFFLRRWWNNYLKRLNKVTNGKPQCCD
ncbi:MAG: YHS domain-containing protein [Deltaproteobacteria bacterium]|uniref:YHS domain-containing protein n=1 Tax=Desulfobacula sp. TaxID=2593537 RepID=UPI0019A7D0BF|nr:YHS domain-containing protein [Candidatus Desulfobacula maris]MBL6996320.1 YHS domain-containing protein [Desulfobacula sp.]